ncbi:COG1361 S-layer family protein [Methanomethylovorans sp.]|uniref:COG1361 S-layer family protein n=1 Tax=Methanomethylovorans sp. TaxID=2758717 RepID=UPI002FDD6A77
MRTILGKNITLFTYILTVMLVFSMFSAVGVYPASAKEFLPATYQHTTNFYTSYGEPDLYASVLGDTELKRGETRDIKIVISNRGVLYGAKSAQGVGTSETKQALAIKELEYESRRTVAYGVKATLLTNSEYIDVDPTTSSQTLEEIFPGQLPDDPLVFTLTVSDKAPAGVYMLVLPLEYEYQKDIRMTQGSTAIVGVPGLDHETYYQAANKTLTIPMVIEPQPRLEVTEVSGQLSAGGMSTINVTYTNTGELPATDAVARIVAMKPLSCDRSMQPLGTIEPGSSRTVSFVISAESTAVAKTYGLDSEIKYIDTDGEIAYSSNMKVDVAVIPVEDKLNITGTAIAGIAITLIVLIFKNILRSMNQKNRGIE